MKSAELVRCVAYGYITMPITPDERSRSARLEPTKRDARPRCEEKGEMAGKKEEGEE